MNTKILFATKNHGKQVEFAAALRKTCPQILIISLADLGYHIPDCIETGTTFDQNALLKVRHTRRYLRGDDRELIVVADDSGIEINELNGEPGVFTRRWSGREMSDQEIINYCLEKLKGRTDRRATYTTCLAVSLPTGHEEAIFGRDYGVILAKPNEKSHLKGVPFRELFFIPELNMMFHEVRELPKTKRNGYQLGHEIVVGQCAALVQKYMLTTTAQKKTSGLLAQKDGEAHH